MGDSDLESVCSDAEAPPVSYETVPDDQKFRFLFKNGPEKFAYRLKKGKELPHAATVNGVFLNVSFNVKMNFFQV